MILSGHEISDLAAEFGPEFRFVECDEQIYLVTADEVYRVERDVVWLRLYPEEPDWAQEVLGVHDSPVHRRPGSRR